MNLANDLIGFEHRDVMKLIARFASKPHRSTAMELCERLERHDAMEGEILHPALRAIDPTHEETARAEHEAIAAVVGRIRDASARSELRALVEELTPLVRSHVKTEERTILPMMEDALGVADMNKLGFAIGDWKRNDEREGEDPSELLELTREELYEKAKLAELRGRSNMSKSELAEALAAA